MFSIELSAQARKFLQKLNKRDYVPISQHLEILAGNPHPAGSIKLKGSDDLYRLRVGNYRIIYSVQHDVLIVHVIIIGHRKDVYD